jgi:hypothetical protein
MKSSKKVNVDIFKLKKVLEEKIEMELPLEKFFYQKFNYRVVIAVIPIFVDEDLYEYKIIKITNDLIMNCELNVTENNLTQLFINSERNSSEVDILKNEVLFVLKNKNVQYINEQTFLKYYKEQLDKLNNNIGI